jgi:2-methylcitrate dehydratase PrpD
MSARFPAERIAVATLRLEDGTVRTSQPTSVRGDPEAPLSDAEVLQKFRTLTGRLHAERQAVIESAVMNLDRDEPAAAVLADAVLGPLDPGAAEVRAACRGRTGSCVDAPVGA